jgi:hypothetical protein
MQGRGKKTTHITVESAQMGRVFSCPPHCRFKALCADMKAIFNYSQRFISINDFL